MDGIDKTIISLLQTNALLPVAEIANKVKLSVSTCWNRIKKLEEDGVIKKRVALIDKEKINLPISVFLTIRVEQHSKEWLEKFVEKITSFEEVVSMYRLTGEADYLLNIVTSSIDQYDQFNQRLIKEIAFKSLNSSIVLKEIKNTTLLPLNHISTHK